MTIGWKFSFILYTYLYVKYTVRIILPCLAHNSLKINSSFTCEHNVTWYTDCMTCSISIHQSLLRRQKAHIVFEKNYFLWFEILLSIGRLWVWLKLRFFTTASRGIVAKTTTLFRISEFPSSITSVENEAVMAAPTKKPERKSRSSKNSKKACLEDQIEERMRASIEFQFSSFEEKMLGLIADFQKNNKDR